MKNPFVSIFAAIALAVPLGIGGLTLTATDAEAVSPGYHFSTCNRHVIWKCDNAIRDRILLYVPYNNLFSSAAVLPRGSNGKDQAAFGALDWRVRTRFEDWQAPLEFLLEFFEHPEIPGTYISPDSLSEIQRRAVEAQRQEEAERNRREAQRLADEQARLLQEQRRDRRAFINHCRNVRYGGIIAATEDRSIACAFRIVYTNSHGQQVSLPRIVYQDELGTDPTAFQITPIEPLGSIADIEDIVDHRQVTSENRGEIIELQGEVTEHEDTLAELEPAVTRNVQVIEALGNSVGVLSEAVTGIAEDTEKNAAGIALAYALDAPGLSYGKRFAITGALGQFRGESAVGFSGTFKAGEFVLISVGGGFAGSGDSSVTGGKLSATYEW